MILEQREEPGKKQALAFTLAVHAVLAAALFFGVQWKRSMPEVMEVELWSASPVLPSAPPPPPPPPPEPEIKPQPKPEPKPDVKIEQPKKPDITVKEEKKKPEPKKPEPPKPEPKPEPKKPEPKAEPAKKPSDPFKEMMEREDRQRANAAAAASAAQAQAQMKAAAEAEARAAAGKRGLADYQTKIRMKIRSNITLPPNIQGNPEATFKVNQLPTGEVLTVKLERSSGNAALDAAIERAILRSSPLPKPDDLSLFQRELNIKYRPLEE